jgi:hypothetical protein
MDIAKILHFSRLLPRTSEKNMSFEKLGLSNQLRHALRIDYYIPPNTPINADILSLFMIFHWRISYSSAVNNIIFRFTVFPGKAIASAIGLALDRVKGKRYN